MRPSRTWALTTQRPPQLWPQVLVKTVSPGVGATRGVSYTIRDVMATQDNITGMDLDPNAAAKLRAFFELSPVIMCITGLDDGRVREVNDAFLQLGGFARDEVVGRHVLDLGLWIDPGQREEGIAMLRAG
ncbi:MAG: PAS domain S-box protein, partial [Candidatus Rokuibacteriota bacterium]